MAFSQRRFQLVLTISAWNPTQAPGSSTFFFEFFLSVISINLKSFKAKANVPLSFYFLLSFQLSDVPISSSRTHYHLHTTFASTKVGSSISPPACNGVIWSSASEIPSTSTLYTTSSVCLSCTRLEILTGPIFKLSQVALLLPNNQVFPFLSFSIHFTRSQRPWTGSKHHDEWGYIKLTEIFSFSDADWIFLSTLKSRIPSTSKT